MTVRFFILQSHYRSPLDFSNDALAASEKALKRLWDAFENLKKLEAATNNEASDKELDNKLNAWLAEFELFMDDDFSTPKIIANMFEMTSVINSLKDKLIPMESIAPVTLERMKERFNTYLTEIFGLKGADSGNNEVMKPVMELLLDIRKEAKMKKDFATSDKIRNQLTAMGIVIKDEKDGGSSWSIG